MNKAAYILISQLSTHYAVERSFFYNLNDNGLIEIITIEQEDYLHEDTLSDFEKILRIGNELHLNIESIDAVMNLLHKIDELQNELRTTRSRLLLYEGE